MPSLTAVHAQITFKVKTCFKPVYFSLIEVADKSREEISREAQRSHHVLEKTQRAAEKRDKHMREKVEALERQVTFQVYEPH